MCPNVNQIISHIHFTLFAVCCCCCVVLKENSSHPPATSSLTLVEEVELVDELIEVVAAFLDTAHQSHEGSVIALRIKLRLEKIGLKHGQSCGQGLGFSDDFMLESIKFCQNCRNPKMGFDLRSLVALRFQLREHNHGSRPPWRPAF